MSALLKSALAAALCLTFPVAWGQGPVNVAGVRPATATGPAPRLGYAATPAGQQAALAAAARHLQPNNPNAAASFAASFGPDKPTSYARLYARLLPGSGLQDNDAADAFAAFVVSAYRVAAGQAPPQPLLPVGVGPAVSRQFGPTLARALAGQPAAARAGLGEYYKLLTVIVYAGSQDKTGGLPAFRQSVAAMLQKQTGLAVGAYSLGANGLVAKAGAVGGSVAGATRPAGPGTAPAAAAAPVPPAAPAGTGLAAGAQWFFRSTSTGYGGITFEPVALLAGGQYVDVGDEPLETLNAAADKARRAAAWGTWRKNGNAFVLTNYKGQPHAYTLGRGNWFPCYPAGAVPLKRAYERTGGGDVGAATVLSISKIRFLDGSRFTMGENMGAMAPNTATGRSSSGSGTYRLQGHTLTLAFANGRTVRKSFALGASGNPARPANTLIFIGGDAYTDE